MVRIPSSMQTEELAARMRQQYDSTSEGMSMEGTSQQVMNGFADAYRAWLEAISSKPDTMIDLQGRYMQEQMKLWMSSMQPQPDAPPPSGDKRFSAPECSRTCAMSRRWRMRQW